VKALNATVVINWDLENVVLTFVWQMTMDKVVHAVVCTVCWLGLHCPSLLYDIDLSDRDAYSTVL